MNTTTNPQTTWTETQGNTGSAKENPPAQAPKRDQLRRRVEERVRDLEATLSSLKGDPGNDERCRTLQTELQLATDCLSGGWDKVSEVEAAKLNQWLEGNQFLSGKSVPDGSTVPGQVENAMEDGRTTVESSRPATSNPGRMPQA